MQLKNIMYICTLKKNRKIMNTNREINNIRENTNRKISKLTLLNKSNTVYWNSKRSYRSI